ncbi:MAG: hypothetical protein ACRBBP_07600 [Bdellovibrionales bacterium]
MKITDAGFKHILSLGAFKESSQVGVYILYSWEGITYYCGLKASESTFKQEGPFIELSLDQLNSIPSKKTTSEDSIGDSQLEVILKYYESALFLEFSKEEALFKAKASEGLLVNLRHLAISSEKPSPFRIVEQTRKPFHGYYSPLGPLKDLLSDLGVNTQNLWMTAVPVIKEKGFKGILIGLSHNKDYGLDSLDIVNKCVKSYKVA